jgi:hypothetical protein
MLETHYPSLTKDKGNFGASELYALTVRLSGTESHSCPLKSVVILYRRQLQAKCLEQAKPPWGWQGSVVYPSTFSVLPGPHVTDLLCSHHALQLASKIFCKTNLARSIEYHIFACYLPIKPPQIELGRSPVPLPLAIRGTPDLAAGPYCDLLLEPWRQSWTRRAPRSSAERSSSVLS